MRGPGSARKDTSIVLEGLLGEGTFGKVYRGKASHLVFSTEREQLQVKSWLSCCNSIMSQLSGSSFRCGGWIGWERCRQVR